MEYTDADVESLANKIDALELSDGERAALAAAFDAPASGDVEGFAYDLNPNDVSFKNSDGILRALGFNIGMPPTHRRRP